MPDKNVVLDYNSIAQLIDATDLSLFWKNQEGEIIGCNQHMLDMFGIVDRMEVIGKKESDYLPSSEAQKIRDIDQQVLTGSSYKGLKHATIGGENKIYIVSKTPLKNQSGNIVGIIGAALDITEREENRELAVYQLVDAADVSLFWKNREGKIIGCNQYMLNIFGITDRNEIIGKSEYDYIPSEEAKKIRDIDQQVLNGIPYKGVEHATIEGINKTYLVSKNPLTDSKGNIVGIIGAALDITEREENQKLIQQNALLRLEQEGSRIAAAEQEKFRKIVDQVAHDIRSPLSAMMMILQASDALPERERLGLRNAASRITDIAQNLLSSYNKQTNKSGPAVVKEEREAMLLSPIILQTLTEKRYQFQNLPVKFDHHFTQTGNFAWIKAESTAFKRTLSNIINNAVDAFDEKEGEVIVRVDATSQQVHIIVEDNGKGMRPELVQKILNQIAVTEGKQDGHGIGLTQVRETLQNNEGELSIESQLGHGTKMIMTFPRIPAQDWIADSIQLHDDDTVVVLDDDSSIHSAWSTRFDELMKQFPHLTVKHFERGQDTVEFIQSLSPENSRKVFLLTDYELLKQSLNGLNVIDKIRARRSILVTSHFANKDICRAAAKAGTTILPKQLAYDIPIQVSPAPRHTEQTVCDDDASKVDAVFVDDEQYLLNTYRMTFGKTKKIDTHCDPEHFMAIVDQYPKNTRIMLDYQFCNAEINGVQLAEKLHERGFTQLYLLSGMSSFDQPVPYYLTKIMKTDVDHLVSCLG